MENKPNPGSVEAQSLGCTCPVWDNHNGEGMFVSGETLFWITSGCPLHHHPLEDVDVERPAG